MGKSKNRIAQDLYGEEFDFLPPGQKARVTKIFNAQTTSTPRRSTSTRASISVAAPASVRVEIGRIGVNGTKACILNKGATVRDLLSQSGYSLDEEKEGIVEQSTTNSVGLDDKVKNGEVYVIAPEIKSA